MTKMSSSLTCLPRNLLAFLLCSKFTAVQGSWVSGNSDSNKDHSYYPDGMENPNVDNEAMYWKDSINILEDLDKFDKLMVEYQGCRWAPLEGGSIGNGDNGDDNDGIIPNCGANYDEEDVWYLGKTACYRANVAYSLYGTLKGEKDVGCKKASFINSFTTFGGLEAWITSMQAMGYFSDIVTTTAFYSNGYGDDDDNRNRQLSYGSSNNYDKKVLGSYCTSDMPYYDDDYTNAGGSYENCDGNEEGGCTYPAFEGVTSYTVGCAANGKFQMFEFEGNYCNGNQVTRRLDRLQQFNRQLQQQKCVAIYDTTGEDNSAYYGQNDDGSNEDDDYSIPSSLSVLTKSRACTVEIATNGNDINNKLACPDPYNKLKSYSNSLNRISASSSQLWNPSSQLRNALIWASIFMFIFGTLLIVFTFDPRLRRIKRAWNWTMQKCGLQKYMVDESKVASVKKSKRNKNKSATEEATEDEDEEEDTDMDMNDHYYEADEEGSPRRPKIKRTSSSKKNRRRAQPAPPESESEASAFDRVKRRFFRPKD